jgi:hypothetical protein
MSLTVESESVARSRRNRRAVITIGVVIALLAAALYIAASYWNSPPAKSPTAAPSCSSGGISPRQVTVNVYNATKRNGLGSATAKLVAARGFVTGTVANDPLKKAIAAPAEVRFGPAGEASAALVVALVPGAVPIKDTRADASVDLVLGDGFKDLAPAPTTTAAGC